MSTENSPITNVVSQTHTPVSLAMLNEDIGLYLSTTTPDPAIHSQITCELYDIAARLVKIQSAMKRHEPLLNWAGGSQFQDSITTIRHAIVGVAGTGDVLAMIEVEQRIETAGLMAVVG